MLLHVFKTDLLLYIAYLSAYASLTNEKIQTKTDSLSVERATPVSKAVEDTNFPIPIMWSSRNCKQDACL